ncbi:MAG: GtrA family protein [Magnetococcales bacterium]|nr:GtrA family protein [Magnetococcales bacterium]
MAVHDSVILRIAIRVGSIFGISSATMRIHFMQGWRFGITGILASLTHIGCIYVFVEWLDLWVHAANLASSIIAALVSYAGNKYWAFQSDASHRFELPRFVIATLLSLISLNTIVAIGIEWFQLHYLPALILAQVITPIQTYIVHHLWTFGAR